jgi:hypothetical protein
MGVKKMSKKCKMTLIRANLSLLIVDKVIVTYSKPDLTIFLNSDIIFAYDEARFQVDV